MPQTPLQPQPRGPCGRAASSSKTPSRPASWTLTWSRAAPMTSPSSAQNSAPCSGPYASRRRRASSCASCQASPLLNALAPCGSGPTTTASSARASQQRTTRSPAARKPARPSPTSRPRRKTPFGQSGPHMLRGLPIPRILHLLRSSPCATGRRRPCRKKSRSARRRRRHPHRRPARRALQRAERCTRLSRTRSRPSRTKTRPERRAFSKMALLEERRRRQDTAGPRSRVRK
mmetsp:Transcript_10913/g.36432  ORF Transcript_10913/g.36432 Transcript_10913/m.36432 type:complete len:232 (-) Transcript_10913:39-734(-)